MIETLGFLAWAAVLFGGAALFDRWRDRRRQRHAHRTLGSRVESWAIRVGILADEETSARLSAIDDDLRRKGL